MKFKNVLVNLLLLLLILIILGLVFGVVGTVLGWWSIGFMQAAFIPSLSQPTYTPTAASSCSDYDVPAEFRSAFTDAPIDFMKTGCLGAGGVWTEHDDEMSCYWDPSVTTVDCTATSTRTLESFCEASLDATWTCDNAIAYAGCRCKVGLPEDWDDECDWAIIDEYVGLIPGNTATEYRASLPAGEFRWSWSLSYPAGIVLHKASGAYASFASTTSGEEEFTSAGEWHGMLVDTSGAFIENNVDLKLWQWLCPWDDLNFDPGMFDEPYSQEEIQGGPV